MAWQRARAAQRRGAGRYRWGVPDSPIDDVQFDPFASPWAPGADDRAVISKPQNEVMAAPDLPALPPPSGPLLPYNPSECGDFRVAVAEYEKAILAAALEKCRWNQRQAAQALNSPTTSSAMLCADTRSSRSRNSVQHPLYDVR
jgi:hypothetical protein